MPINFTPISSQRGMTLIEVAVTLLIAGIILAGALIGIDSYWQSQLREKQIARFERVQQAIGAFVYNHGRYPCPAFNNYTASNDDYGVEVCPTNGIGVNPGPPNYPTSAGTCTSAGGKGLCWQRGRRGGSANSSPSNPVLRGMLPFKTLGVSEEYAYDIYGSRLVYAVTDAMTRVYDPGYPTKTFGLNNGAVQVRKYDPKQNARLDTSLPTGSNHFFIFSPGKNRAGGINAAGDIVVPCSTLGSGTDEFKQCQVTTASGDTGLSANYFAHLYNLASNTSPASAFDDRGFYFAPSDPNAWGAGKNVNVAADKLGLGSNNPGYDLEVAGDIMVRHDLIVAGPSGICDDDGSCLDPYEMSDVMDCTGAGGIGSIPSGWEGADFSGANCQGPTAAFDCGTYDDGGTKYKIFAGIQSGQPICIRGDMKCDPQAAVLCAGEPNEITVILPLTDNGDNYDPPPVQSVQFDSGTGTYDPVPGQFANYRVTCGNGVWGDPLPVGFGTCVVP